MDIEEKPFTFDRVFRLAFSLAGLLVVIYLMAYLSDALIPFAVAFLLAYLLNPIVEWVQKRLNNRVAAVTITLSVGFGLLLLFFFILFPMVTGELKRMGALANKLVTEKEFGEKIKNYIPPSIIDELKSHASQEEIFNLLKEEKSLAIVTAFLKKVLPGVWGIFAGTASFFMGLLGLVVIGLYLIFMLLDFQRVKMEWRDLIPKSYQKPVFHFLKEFDVAMSRHFRAQAVVAALVGVLFSIGFWLIGLPLSILLGLFLGLLNMVPYLQIAGFFPAALLALVRAVETEQSIWVFLGLTLLVFVVVQLIQDTILTPKIMGKVTGLSPAMILLSISVWGKLLGFLGLIIALPMTCLTLAYYREIMASMMQKEDEIPRGENDE